MNVFPKSLTTLLLLLMAPHVASAELVTITPGLWEVEVVDPAFGEDSLEQQCIDKDLIDPAKMVGLLEGCESTRRQVLGTTVFDTFDCIYEGHSGEPFATRMKLSFTINEDQGDGHIEMFPDPGESSLSLRLNLKASRIGAC